MLFIRKKDFKSTLHNQEMSNQSEGNIGKKIMLALGSIKGVRIFRNNVGTAWVGNGSVRFNSRQEVIVNAGDVLIRQARVFHAGLCKGSSDFIGFKSAEITPEMVGKPIAIFMAAEIKTKSGKASPEQVDFINMVNKFGGIAFLATDEIEAVQFLNKK